MNSKFYLLGLLLMVILAVSACNYGDIIVVGDNCDPITGECDEDFEDANDTTNLTGTNETDNILPNLKILDFAFIKNGPGDVSLNYTIFVKNVSLIDSMINIECVDEYDVSISGSSVSPSALIEGNNAFMGSPDANADLAVSSVTCNIDPQDFINESNEEDNIFVYTPSEGFGLPNLNITDVQIISRGTNYFYLNYTYFADFASSIDSEVYLRCFDEFDEFFSGPTLGDITDGYNTVDRSPTSASANLDATELTCTIDYYDVVFESNENDNVFVFEISERDALEIK